MQALPHQSAHPYPLSPTASFDEVVAWLRASGVKRLVSDSRRVESGDAFIAWPGHAQDGRSHVPAALAAGAIVCLVEASGADEFPALAEHLGKRVAAYAELKAATGEIASRFDANPSASLPVIAITGTNGKTSTAWWLAQASSLLGRRAGFIGTLGAGEPPSAALPAGQLESTGLTTPDPVSLQAALQRFGAKGFKACALEASSIGIVEHRLAGTSVDVAVFTNFTRDHLDYHGSMTAYWEAKSRLFDWPGLRAAVINIDDEQGASLAAQLSHRPLDLWTCSAEGAFTAPKPEARLRARSVGYLGGGLFFEVVEGDPDTEGGESCFEVRSNLIGDYNVSNLLAVFATLRSMGHSLQEAVSISASLTPVPGRMQRVAAGAGALPAFDPFGDPAVDASVGEPAVVVDYAHTPDALDKTLRALRPLADQRGGKLICVFGCGGNRDITKRPLMGAIAARLADRVVLTSDNPRLEDPKQILAQIAAGFTEYTTARSLGQDALSQVADRAAAIAQAVLFAAPRDVVLIAGKGHEADQDLAGAKLPFSDVQHAQWAVQRRLAGRPMFTLADAGKLITGAVAIGEPGTLIDRVHSDTRTLRPGDLFVALKGERFDAHEFLPQARAAGAVAAIAGRGLAGANLPGILVPNTLKALGELATGWRARFDLPLIAVTGSNGKTTVTQMIASILRAWVGDAAFSTQGNFNNDIGVPLTLLRLRHGSDGEVGHEAAVIELGMNHPGEIAELARMAAPTVALVNNAQREHQEFMGSVEAVARENGAVIALLRPDGVAVFPADDVHADIWRKLAGARRTTTFALQGAADVIGTAQWVGGQCRLHLRTPQGDADCRLHIAGWHNVKNALAASACALSAGCSLDAVVRGLEMFEPVKGRSQLKAYQRQGAEVTLVDDTYNANPDSVRAAIEVLASLPLPGWLVLGDMGEVGDAGPEFHREVGAYAATLGVNWLWTVGTLCMHASEAFEQVLATGAWSTSSFDAPNAAGQRRRGARHFANMGALLAAVADDVQVPPAASVVVKGSRFMKMEQVVAVLVASRGERSAHAA